MKTLLLFLILLTSGTSRSEGLTFSPTTQKLMAQLKSQLTCPQILKLSLEKQDSLLRPDTQQSGPPPELSSLCSYKNKDDYFLDLVIARSLTQSPNPDNTWAMTLFAWQPKKRFFATRYLLLELHLEVSSQWLDFVDRQHFKIVPTAKSFFSPSEALKKIAWLWCPTKGCASAVSRSAEILKADNVELAPASEEITLAVQDPRIQRSIDEIYNQLQKRLDGKVFDSTDLWNLTLKATDQNQDLALYILGFVLNRESKSLISYGPLLVQQHHWSEVTKKTLKEISEIYPLCHLVEAEQSHFMFPLKISEGEPYHFWSSAYMSRRLLRENFSDADAISGGYAFGHAYNLYSLMGDAWRAKTSNFYWNILVGLVSPLSEALHSYTFNSLILAPSHDLYKKLNYSNDYEYWLLRERSEWLHFAGSIYGVRPDLIGNLDLDHFIKTYSCFGPFSEYSIFESPIKEAKLMTSEPVSLTCDSQDKYLEMKYAPGSAIDDRVLR